MRPDDSPVLGISLGTRILGVAVVKGKELRLWQTKRWRNKWSPEKLQALLAYVDTTMGRYGITAIGIKVPPRGHFSHGLIELVSELSKMAAVRHLPVKTYRIQELKRLCSERSLNRDGMMRCIIGRFDFLQSQYLKEHSSKHSYHVKMFEAILAALAMEDRISSTNRRIGPSS
jgi:hypothetical protein